MVNQVFSSFFIYSFLIKFYSYTYWLFFSHIADEFTIDHGRLENCVLSTLVTRSHIHCIRQCIQDTACRSINVKPVENEYSMRSSVSPLFVCELNRGARSSPGIMCSLNEIEVESTYYEFPLD